MALLVARRVDQPQAALAALYEVATKMLASLDLDEVLLLVANAASRLLDAEIAGIFLVDDRNEELVMRQVVGHRSVGTARLRVRCGQGLAGLVLQTGRPHRVDDYTADTSITKEFQAIASEEGTQSALCSPMQVLGRTIGTLCVWRRRASVFTDEAERVLSSLAHLATMAVHNAHLYEAERAATTQLRDTVEQLQERYRATERALRMHQELTRIAVNGDDVAAVAHALRSLTEGTVALLGDDLSPVVPSQTEDEQAVIQWLRSWLRVNGANLGRPSYVLEANNGRPWAIVAPIRASGRQFGHLCLALAEAPDQAAVAAAEQAATVCALLLAIEEAAISATRRLQSEFVWDLLEGRIPDEAEAAVRARHLGHGFELPARVLLVQVVGLEQLANAERWEAERLERARGQVAQALLHRIEASTKRRPVLARRAELFAVIVPQPKRGGPSSPRELGQIAVSAAPFSVVQQTAGVSGRVDSVSALPEAFRQAQFALSACSPPREPVAVFDDLGVLQFLLAPAGRGDLDRFAQSVLGALLAYDRSHETQLVRSIEAYINADCNLKQAADTVFVHHKTMRYRLQRIHELTGLRLDHQEDRFQVQLALKILALDQRGRLRDDRLPEPSRPRRRRGVGP